MFIEKLIDDFGMSGSIVLAIIGLALLVYIIIKISNKTIAKKLKPLAEMLNAEVKSSFLFGSYIEILNYGPEMHLRLTFGGNNSPPYLHLDLLNPVGFNFRITRRQVLNEILFRWGKEVNLDDVSIDEDLLIRADKPMEAASYLMDSRRKDAIKYFFENGFTEIKAISKGVYISKENYTKDDLVPEKVQTYLDNLNTFSRM
jgi:hypothetical protein